MSLDDFNINRAGAMQCAPVIAGIKPSNLLILRNCHRARDVRRIIGGTGLRTAYLYCMKGKNVWLVYDEAALAKALSEEGARRILKKAGYDSLDPGRVIKTVRQRLERYIAGEAGYPHELGVVLGYPAADVEGFVEHGGRNCLESGYWKVYGDVGGARRTFKAYTRAKEAAASYAESGVYVGEMVGALRAAGAGA